MNSSPGNNAKVAICAVTRYTFNQISHGIIALTATQTVAII